MIATREEQKVKAIELLKKLNVHELLINCVLVGKENFVRDFFAIRLNNPKLKDIIENFEKTTGCMVYYVTHEEFSYGECYSFLVVSKYEEDIQRTDVRTCEDGSLAVMAWVENITKPAHSEYGTILVRNKDGFLHRVY